MSKLRIINDYDIRSTPNERRDRTLIDDDDEGAQETTVIED